jgi:hypothetical protein
VDNAALVAANAAMRAHPVEVRTSLCPAVLDDFLVFGERFFLVFWGGFLDVQVRAAKPAHCAFRLHRQLGNGNHY